MKIFLVRHGETVDNIAGVYAGVRDSHLTNYGVEQTVKLGEHLVTIGVRFTHIFASPLIRASQTAEAILRSQLGTAEGKSLAISILKVKDLIEQDFGYYEGKPFQARSSPRKTGREADAEVQRRTPGFQDVESKDSMCKRADAFLDEHLMPLTLETSDSAEPIVAIVSHGMLLSTLWRRMLARVSPGSVTVAPEVTAARGPLILDRLGGWSNTGYLELSLQRRLQRPVKLSQDDPRVFGTAEDADTTTGLSPPQALTFKRFTVSIVAVDSRTHLHGLKRQRGGIGRLVHDTNQRKLDGFFKRPKTG